MIKVFIVDDHEIIREGLKKILFAESDMTVVGEAENGTDLLRQMGEVECDILLLDLNLPGRNGIELIEELKKKFPAIQILILSINPESKSALPSLNAGASGYVSKDAALEEMVKAIRKIYAKGRYLSPTLAEQLAFNLLQPEPLAKTPLTSLESNIAVMISNGKTAKNCADELGLSISTIFTNRRKILSKLKINNNVQLTHYVIESHLSNY